MERRIVVAGRLEVGGVEPVMTVWREIRRDVRRVRRNRDRCRERDFLPAVRGLSRDRRARELRSRAGPHMTDVRPSVARTFVEADAGDVAGALGSESDAELLRVRIVDRGDARRRGRAPNRKVFLRRRLNRDAHADTRHLEVAAVVDGAAANDGRCAGGNPRIAPGFTAVRRMPRGAAIDRHVDAAHHAAEVRCRACDADRDAALNCGAERKRVDRRCRHDRIGRGARDVQTGGGQERARRDARLDTHVGEQVHHRLLHAEVRRGTIQIVVVVEAPGPLNRAGSKHEGAAGMLVQRQMVRHDIRRERVAVIEEMFVDGVDRRRRHANDAGGARPVVEIFVPLVADDAGRELRRHIAGGERRDVGVAPEAHPAVGRRDEPGRSGAAVDGENLSADRVLRTSAIRAEPRIAPRAGPRRGGLIDLGVRPRLLVRHERPIVVLPPRLPVHLVAAREHEMSSAVARRFDVGALLGGPVLVVARRHEHLVRENRVGRARVAREIGGAQVADVVAVRFEKAHHRVLGAEHEAARVAVAPGVERTVVAQFVRARGTRSGRRRRAADVEAVAAVRVVGLPRRVRRLHDHVGRARVVAHDEEEVAGARPVVAHGFREIDAGRHRRRRG